jgi:iron complex outermembrane receptor protein
VKWKDQQVSVNLGLNLYDYQTENAGKSHLYGFEVESQYRPTQNFDAYASVGYSRTEFDDFAINTGTATLDLAGAEFAYAPHWTWAVGANYRWDNGLSANVNANYRAKAFADTGANQSIYAIKSRILVNAKLAYAYRNWEVAAFGRNLFDEKYFQYDNIPAQRAIIGDPRVLGVSLETRW